MSVVISNNLVPVVLTVDGACAGNGTDQTSMGVGVVARSGAYTREKAIPLGPGTNNQAELWALIHGLRLVKNRPGSAVTVRADSQNLIGWTTLGWKVKVEALRPLVAEAKQLVGECGSFEFSKVKGHAGDPDNERADELAVLASKGGVL